MDANLLQYLLRMLPLSYNVTNNLCCIDKKVIADLNCIDLQTLELKINLPANQYMNWNSFHLCLPIMIKKSTNEANDLAANMITVNNFFCTSHKRNTY